MNDIDRFNLTAIIICGLLILLGVWIERWMVGRGIVRDKTFLVVAIAISSVFMKELWFPAVSWWVFATFTILAMTLGANRGDLWTTMNQGRWWWEEDRDKNS